MPRKPPAEPIDHHYNISRLNRVFFVSGAILTATFIWMVIADYSRDWKGIQRTFLRLDRDKTLEARKALWRGARQAPAEPRCGAGGDSRPWADSLQAQWAPPGA